MSSYHRRFLFWFALLSMVFAVGRISPHAHAQAAEAHPVHIHKGTCATLGDVVFPLTDIAVAGPGTATPEMDVAEVEGTPSADADSTPMADEGTDAGTSVTTVAAKLDDIIAGGHAINAHESADQIQTYIACGDITGTATDGALKVELKELNSSGYSGEAELKDNGDGTTTVSIELYALAASGTPVAAAGTPVAVILADFSVTPAQTSFKVGEAYTFTATNTGAALHEMVIEKSSDVDVPLKANGQTAEIGDIQPGTSGTMTWTFTEPGTYRLACHQPDHFEAGMVTTITVSS